MKKQVLIIHGGDTFETYNEYLSFLKDFKIYEKDLHKKGWKDSLQEKLGDTFEVIAPKMPNKMNAKYEEWKIWFEKFIPFIKDDVILVGHSLGGIFLVKYLSENKFPRKIKATFLVAAPFDATDTDYTLADFKLEKHLALFNRQGGSIHLYYSEDDPIVPFANLEKYKEQLPKVKITIFNDREHFGQEEFPELIKAIEIFCL